MIDLIFRLCVWILEVLAGLTGMSYEAINVLIFCIGWPGLTAWLIWKVWQLTKEVQSLRKENIQPQAKVVQARIKKK